MDTGLVLIIRKALSYDLAKGSGSPVQVFPIRVEHMLVNMRMEGFSPCWGIPDSAKISVVINWFPAILSGFLVRTENGLSLAHGGALSCMEMLLDRSVFLLESKEAFSARQPSNSDR
jgi:hypothetical protein